MQSKLVTLFLIMHFFIGFSYGMEDSVVTFDMLPDDCIEKVVEQLSDTVMQDEGDIHPLVQNITNVSSVNRRLHAVVNSNEIVTNVVHCVSHRLNISPLDAAALLRVEGKRDWPGVLTWIEKNIDESEEYRLFKVVQRIQDMFEETIEEFKLYGVSRENIQKGLSNKLMRQTKQGIFIAIDNVPRALFTQWGNIILFERGNTILFGGIASTKQKFGYDAFTQSFLKKMTTRPCISRDSFDPIKFYELQSPDIDLKDVLVKNSADMSDNLTRKYIFKEISYDDLQKKDRTNNMIKGKKFNGLIDSEVVYEVLAVGNQQLPAPKLLEKSQYRTIGVVTAIWTILMEWYTKEKKMASENQATS